MSNSSLSRTIRIAIFDFTRLFRKKTTYLVIILFILPFITALILKTYSNGARTENPELWSYMLGVNISAGDFGGSLLLGGLVNLFSWWWLIVALYAGDLIARDLQDGTAYLVLSRAVSRLELLAGKIISNVVLLTVFSVIGAYTVYFSAWILAGKQSYAWGPLLSGLALVYGSLPLLAVGVLFGILTRKSTTSIISVVAVYFITSIVIGILSIMILFQKGEGNPIEIGIMTSNLLPLDGGKHLASLIFTYLAKGPTLEIPPYMAGAMEIGGQEIRITAGPIDLGKYMYMGILSTLVWTVLLLGIAYFIFRKKDL